MKRSHVVFSGILTLFSTSYAVADTNPEYVVTASYYSSGKLTASGERFDRNGFTAASRTLPFGTRLRVTNLATGRSVIVRVNDRGPFVRGRDLDLAKGAADAIGMIEAGTAKLRVAHQ